MFNMSSFSANDYRNFVQPLVNCLIHQVLPDLFPAGLEHIFHMIQVAKLRFLSSFLMKSFKVFFFQFSTEILALFAKHFNPFPASNILLNTYLLLLKVQCLFITDTIYDIINFCIFHISLRQLDF